MAHKPDGIGEASGMMDLYSLAFDGLERDSRDRRRLSGAQKQDETIEPDVQPVPLPRER
jgi:hypothetical protein